jgi:hypothetical protein
MTGFIVSVSADIASYRNKKTATAVFFVGKLNLTLQHLLILPPGNDWQD